MTCYLAWKPLKTVRRLPPEGQPVESFHVSISFDYQWVLLNSSHLSFSCHSWSCAFDLNYSNLQYCLLQQVFFCSSDYQNWVYWNFQKSCLKQISLLVLALIACPSKPTAEVLKSRCSEFLAWVTGAASILALINALHGCCKHLFCPHSLLLCSFPAHCWLLSPRPACSPMLSKPCGCHFSSSDILEMQQQWFIFLKPEIVVSFS